MKKIRTLFMMMLLAIVILGACASDEEAVESAEEPAEENQNTEDPIDPETEEQTEDLVTMSEMEVTPFEEIEGEKAIKTYPSDWEDPYDLEDLRYELYYGDNELIAMALNDGIFRYDTAGDEVVWQIDNRSAGSMMHDGQLYVKQLTDSTPASMSVVNLEDGS